MIICLEPGMSVDMQKMMNEHFLPHVPNPYFYNFLANSYSRAQDVVVDKGCYGWMAVNLSDGLVKVNDWPLVGAPAPGFSGAAIGLLDYFRIYRGRISITFGAAVTTPLVAIGQVIIVTDIPIEKNDDQ